MSDSIDEHIDRRLERWALWLYGQRRVSVAPWARLRTGIPAPQSIEATEKPMVNSEALETDALIRQLPERLARVVCACYPRSDSTKAEIAASMDISRSALDYRLHLARVRLWVMLEDRRRGQRQQPQQGAVAVPGMKRHGRGRTIASVAPR